MTDQKHFERDDAAVARASFTGCCPRCGKDSLFRSGLVLKEKCGNCGLSYSFADSGDGPAVFAIFILGFLVLGGALIAEFRFNASIWFHLVTWGLLTPLLAIGLLRVIKSMLIVQQYRTKAEQGVLERKTQ